MENVNGHAMADQPTKVVGVPPAQAKAGNQGTANGQAAVNPGSVLSSKPQVSAQASPSTVSAKKSRNKKIGEHAITAALSFGAGAGAVAAYESLQSAGAEDGTLDGTLIPASEPVQPVFRYHGNHAKPAEQNATLPTEAPLKPAVVDTLPEKPIEEHSAPDLSSLVANISKEAPSPIINTELPSAKQMTKEEMEGWYKKFVEDEYGDKVNKWKFHETDDGLFVKGKGQGFKHKEEISLDDIRHKYDEVMAAAHPAENHPADHSTISDEALFTSTNADHNIIVPVVDPHIPTSNDMDDGANVVDDVSYDHNTDEHAFANHDDAGSNDSDFFYDPNN